MRKKFLRRSILILFAFVLLVAGFLIEERFRGKWMLASYRKELRARGEKLDLKELNIPKVSQGNNGAKLLLEAADDLTALKQEIPLVWNIKTMISSSPGYAQEIIRKDSLELPDGKKGSWEEFDTEIQKIQPCLTKAREALSHPIVQFDFDYSEGFERLEHVGKAVTIARAFSAQAIFNLRHGLLDEVIENIEVISGLDRFSKDEPLVISQLVALPSR